MKTIFTALLMLPLLIQAQSKSTWQVFADKKMIVKGIAGELKDCMIHSKATKIAIKYIPSRITKNWDKALVLMDTNRIEIERKPLAKDQTTVSIKKNILYADAKSRPVIAYMVSTPSDKHQAALVRVAPVPLVKLAIKE